MKKLMSALLALSLCLSAALADGEVVRDEIPAQSASASAPVTPEVRKPEVTPSPAASEGAEDDFEKEMTEAPISPAEAEPGDSNSNDGSEPTAPEGQGEAEAPGGDDLPGETASPEESAAPGETAAPGAEVADPDADPAAPEGYVLIDGVRREGTLSEILAEPGEKTVYLLAKEPVKIEEFPLALLKDVTFLPDPETFPDGKFAAKLMNGEAELTPEAIAAATDEIITLNVSVVELPAEPEETQPPVDPGTVALKVDPQNFEPGVWMNWNPEFRLSGIPAGSEGYCYVAVIYDERFIPLSGDFYIPMEEGVYTLRFAIMDPQGDVADSSELYELMLDLTPPALSLEVSPSKDYTLTLSAADLPGGEASQCSGVAEFSLDGGESWAPLGEGESVVHTESRKKVFPPQTILVRDAAGNVSGNIEEIVLDKIPDLNFGGWGGGGGGGESKPSVPHASGSGDDAPYASYELELPEGAVEELSLGGEAVELNLSVDGEGPAMFTAELRTWARESASSESGAEFIDESESEPAKDTLVLRAEANEAGEFVWRINGSVLRKLYNSEIAYLALAAGDSMLSLPTVGFTAGTRYAQLKMGGVSTGEFAYEISMRTGTLPSGDAWNLSPDCEVGISVTVEGERFEMLDRDATPEMYLYDVYCGPADLPDYPYGAYPQAEMED